MIQPDQTTRAQLYAGTSDEGRTNYLRSRARHHRPDERYVYPLVSSWRYGWRLEQEPWPRSEHPRHGRRRVVMDTFYSRNGLPHLHHPNCMLE